MITSDKLKELEEKKKKAIDAIDAEIEQVKNLAKAHEDFTALVSKYKYENATAFLSALNLLPATVKGKKIKAPKTPRETSPLSGDGLKKGPFSQAEKDKAKKLKEEGLSASEIATKLNRSAKAVEKALAA